MMLFIEYQNWRTMGTNVQWSNKNNEIGDKNLVVVGVWLSINITIYINSGLIDFDIYLDTYLLPSSWRHRRYARIKRDCKLFRKETLNAIFNRFPIINNCKILYRYICILISDHLEQFLMSNWIVKCLVLSKKNII